jgi:hypothetical protein
MAYSSYRKAPSLRRLHAETRLIRTVNQTLTIAVAVVLGGIVYCFTFPEKHRLAEIQERLRSKQLEEKLVLAEKEQRMMELQALDSDKEFIELKAADRLNLHHPGEKILRIKREDL